MRISHHTLRVENRASALDFYCNKLGMQAHGTANSVHDGETITHDLLAFPAGESMVTTQLELLSSSTFSSAIKTDQTGYWKIGVTVADVDCAVERLRNQGIDVSQPQQFRDIGYLCHLNDPSGNTIELLQHYFAGNKPTTLTSNDLALGTPGQIGQITLRIKDPEKSITFYRDKLVMKLLSRQKVEPYGFTLYFLAYCDDAAPVPDIDAVENREWLWQRPYTTLELQHVWGTENSEFRYDVSAESGFEHMAFSQDCLRPILEAVSDNSVAKTETSQAELFDKDSAWLRDPDGYRIRLLADQ